MRNVRRPTMPPPSLVNNAGRWKRQLLQEIRKKGGKISKVSNSFFDKYNKDDVKKTLYNMYNGLCCYCEEKVGVVEYGNIEHRKPKRKFPRSTYDWDNMHLSCTICNTNKGERYNKRYPILDAVVDNPIEKHLQYSETENDGVYVIWRTRRGKTTVEHADLDRWELRAQRSLVCVGIQKVIIGIKSSPNRQKAKCAKATLQAKCTGRYGSMIKYLMKQHRV